MGLFSSVLHVRGTKREQFLPALDDVLGQTGFKRAETIPITKKGPFSLPGQDKAINKGPYYLVSELNGDWLTLIEAHFALEDAPDLAGVGKRISEELSTYALALSVHDDDLFLYNLEHNGESLDGYNSCPQYFESRPLSKTELKAQRHSPEAFAPLLPSRRAMTDLKAVLDRGVRCRTLKCPVRRGKFDFRRWTFIRDLRTDLRRTRRTPYIEIRPPRPSSGSFRRMRRKRGPSLPGRIAAP
jgi:hypothetical protein